MNRTIIVVPTYNECETIENFLDGIFENNIENLGVIVVDDNSPDGTGVLVDTYAKKKSVTIIHRSKRMGLGTAYIDGFREAIRMGADYIFEIDADFSHDPKDIPRFLATIKSYDLVLGSRYMRGGTIENWGIGRRFISRFGNLYARVILWLPYHDLTGGFKCYRREVLEKINLTHVSSRGYNFQIETTYLAHKSGFRIKEIPITFKERRLGVSKFNFNIIIESFVRVLLLAIKKL